MIGRLSPEECAERGRGCKGLLEEQVVEGERAAQEVGGMLRRGRQPAVLAPVSPRIGSRARGQLFGGTLSHRPSPHRGCGRSPQAVHGLPLPANHDPD